MDISDTGQLSKRSLLKWAADRIQLPPDRFACLEQCSNAAVYCQLLDSSFPGAVNMPKVHQGLDGAL